MKIRGLALAGALALAAAGVAMAQEQTINAYVTELVESLADDGQTRVGQIRLDEIGEGDSAEFGFDLDPEKSYFVYAACDDDCTDIDMFAFDFDDDIVDFDEEDDDLPFLMIGPGQSGDSMRIQVDMMACDADLCVVGVGLYEIED